MQTPVAIVFFNRIEPLRQLVARLSEVMPQKVYLISDGAREGRVGESEKVAECREFMLHLPWECEIRSNFADKNMGCRTRVTSGLDWIFEQEERAIILEDDCIPELAFFPWVERILERCKDDKKVLSVGGTNLRPKLCDRSLDAVFTKYAMIWGWATWRRAWLLNDRDLVALPDACRRHHFKQWLGKWRAEWYWRYLLTHVMSSWGYRWAFTHFANDAYCVVPPVNLVENIGMTDVNATHTSSNPYDLAKTDGSWQCGSGDEYGIKLDTWIEDNFFSRSLPNRVKWLVKKVIHAVKNSWN